jgi:DNA-binding response OmpR family regulator
MNLHCRPTEAPANGPTTRTSPVSALTAHAVVGDHWKAPEAGCDDYEIKPVDPSRLVIELEALFGTRAAQPATPANQTFSLLIVDGNEMNREGLARRLHRPEYRISRARNGGEALEVIGTAPVDLVLLDARMPEMSGLEVLRAIRTRHSMIDLRVIMVTAQEQTGDVVTALEMGANDYVTKPLNFPIVVARVHTQLALKRARLVGGTQQSPARAPAAGPAPTGPNAPSAPGSVEILNDESASRPGRTRGAVVRREPPPRTPTQPRGDESRSRAEGPVATGAPTSSTASTEFPRLTVGGLAPSGPVGSDHPRLSGYEILGEIGRGATGVVYRARHEQMNRIVAIKVINRHHRTSAETLRRFYHEARAAPPLAHPNIVLAYGAGEYEDTFYFVMEHVEGHDLAALVRKRGPLAVEDACHCVIQAARGLQHAHERGMVHRGIKPSHLLATWALNTSLVSRSPAPAGPLHALARSTIKILDMGLALSHQSPDPSAAAAVTRDSRGMSTADYLAPEQWINAHKVDIRADLYGLGCTFYYLLTGAVPFPGAEPMEKMLEHHLGEPEPLEQVRPCVPPKVAAAIQRLLAKKPEHRFPEPAALIDALS